MLVHYWVLLTHYGLPGLGAHRVMQVAESLYINGYISYPRTESSAYPGTPPSPSKHVIKRFTTGSFELRGGTGSFDLKGTLRMVGAGNAPWSEHCAELLAEGDGYWIYLEL